MLSESAPQYCVVALVLTERFSMNTSYQFRPRPACLTCQVDEVASKLLKGVPNLAGYGLQSSAKPPKAGSYKGPERLRDYLEEDSTKCALRNLTTRETYCLKKLGEEYRCDGGRLGTQLGVRDYGALLINRIGRRGYKINFQVVMLLWDFKLVKYFPQLFSKYFLSAAAPWVRLSTSLPGPPSTG